MKPPRFKNLDSYNIYLYDVITKAYIQIFGENLKDNSLITSVRVNTNFNFNETNYDLKDIEGWIDLFYALYNLNPENRRFSKKSSTRVPPGFEPIPSHKKSKTKKSERRSSSAMRTSFNSINPYEVLVQEGVHSSGEPIIPIHKTKKSSSRSSAMRTSFSSLHSVDLNI